MVNMDNEKLLTLLYDANAKAKKCAMSRERGEVTRFLQGMINHIENEKKKEIRNEKIMRQFDEVGYKPPNLPIYKNTK